MTITQRLAAKITAFDAAQIGPAALAQAKACILDTVGVTLAGMAEECTRRLLAVPGIAAAPGPALILGSARTTSALDAALVNGTASHALDFDDFSATSGAHHSVTVVPLIMALAGEMQVSGRAALAAYVIGVEVETRIGRGVNYHHYDKGWHPTSTLGVFGAAAAACHLLRLDEAQTATALAIAGSFASGMKANFGTMVKPLHVGHCGRSGLLAARLAEAGYDASATMFEHHQGFFEVYNGAGTYDAERIFADWANPLEIEAPEIGIKQFPCCGSTHPAIHLALQLRREEGLTASDIAAIEILPQVRRLRHTNNPRPRTIREAKFSVQYGVARALLDGAVRLKDFEGTAYLDPAIDRLLDVTTARPHPAMPEEGAAQWAAEVILTLKDGRTVSRRIDNLVARGGDHPMSDAELWDKFSDCAGRALPQERARMVYERLTRIEDEADLGALVALMGTADKEGEQA